MKKAAIILIISSSLAGCSSSEQRAGSLSSGNSHTSNGQANGGNSVNFNAPTASNQTMIPYKGMQNVDPNIFNQTTLNVKQVNRPVNTNQSLTQRIAPDDSVFSASMNKNGMPVETRTFNSHPILAKVEKQFLGKEVKYKVYLRNGKVLEGPADKLENYRVMGPGNILEAVGIDPNLTTKNQSKPSEKKEP
jgi:hypothetical protein